jgi:hypothetical protein
MGQEFCDRLHVLPALPLAWTTRLAGLQTPQCRHLLASPQRLGGVDHPGALIVLADDPALMALHHDDDLARRLAPERIVVEAERDPLL